VVVPTSSGASFDSGYFDHEARRLAEKYKFEVEDVLSPNLDGLSNVLVLWLEPAQVAALRCEMSVIEIGFRRILTTISSGSPY
jgi:hypothetical protein